MQTAAHLKYSAIRKFSNNNHVWKQDQSVEAKSTDSETRLPRFTSQPCQVVAI